MERVKVGYKGERAAALRYFIKPGGKLYTAQGYLFGASRPQSSLLPDEAAVLTNLDADAVGEGGAPMTTTVRGKEVRLKNRDLVTTGHDGKPIPEGDSFELVGQPAPTKASPKKKSEDK